MGIYKSLKYEGEERKDGQGTKRREEKEARGERGGGGFHEEMEAVRVRSFTLRGVSNLSRDS